MKLFLIITIWFIEFRDKILIKIKELAIFLNKITFIYYVIRVKGSFKLFINNSQFLIKQKVNTPFKVNIAYTNSMPQNFNKASVSLSGKKSTVNKKILVAAAFVCATVFGLIRKTCSTNAVKKTINAVKDCEALTFNTPNLNLIKKKYNSKNIYDLGIKYATIANNTKQATGRSLLKNEIPQIFRGIDEKTLLNELDNLPATLNSAVLKIYPENSGIISIAGKDFKFKTLGQGGSNIAYKLSDKMGNSICFKHSHYAPTFGLYNNGIIDEVAILNEANKAGVVDVPKLYMANLFGVKQHRYKPIKGCWQLVELIETPKTIDVNGLRLKKWLKDIGLVHIDLDKNPNNIINGIVVDMGMIIPKAKNSNIDLVTSKKIMKGFNESKTTAEVLQSL